MGEPEAGSQGRYYKYIVVNHAAVVKADERLTRIFTLTILNID